jgi:predicted RNase H-like HicB family nuclease
MKAKDYPIFLIYSEDEEAWLARVDQLPGLVVDGATPEEALANAKDAIVSWIETTKELGRKVPEPLSEEKLHQLQAELNMKQNEFLQQAFNQAVALAAQSQKSDYLPSGTLSWGREGVIGGKPFTRSEGFVKA